MKKRSTCCLFCVFQISLTLLLYGQTTTTPTSTPTKERADTIFLGTVVSMDSSRHIFADGAVAVTGDTIVAVGPRLEIEAKYEGRQIVDARNKLVLPGLINGHTHVPMTLFRGLHDDVTLNDWLEKYIFPAEAKKR